MKNNIIRLSYIFLLIITFIGCIDNRDPYYTKKGGWDYQRIPLIKPYSASNTGNGWLVCKPHKEIIGISKGITHATRLNIIDSILLVQWNNDLTFSNYTDTTWSFIIVPLEIEATFSNERKFLDSLKYYTDIIPTYRDIDLVWEQFSNTGYLEWFPDEFKPE